MKAKCYSTSEAAQVLGIGPRSVRRMLEVGFLKASKVNSKWSIGATELKKAQTALKKRASNNR